MKVAVVCRLNQARSPFGEIVLKSLFPQHQFFSAGISALPNSVSDARVAATAQRWKLGHTKEQSELVSDVMSEIIACDMVIAADNVMKSEIARLGFKGRIWGYDEFVNDKSFLPIDPIGLAQDKLEQELAKVAYCCVQGFRIANNEFNKNTIHLFIPSTDEDSAQAYLMAKMAQSQLNGLLLDIDFRSPGANKCLSEFKVVSVNSREELFQFETFGDTVLTLKWEDSNPESILLSKEFKDCLRRFSNSAPVFMVSAPRYSRTRRIPDSYLAAIWADKITVVSS